MKKLSILLVLIMLSTLLLPAFAEEAQGPTEKEILEMPCEFALIEADEAIGQPRLTYIEGVTPILEVDGLKFKDLNKNGELDVYEDYRKDIEDRVWDLIAQLTPEEEAGLHFCVSANLNTARAMIPDFKNNCMLFNLNGAPVAVVNTLNNLQATGEAERLGIPMTFTSDRAYNAFGGYIDMPHIAFGTANDPELAYKLSYIYGECMVAVGVHVTFEPYANEIGAQYGENPEHIAAIVSQTVKGLEDSGFASCVKHWIGRGGDASFERSRSVAQNTVNWMVGWEAALSGGNEWVMTNCDGVGFSNTVDPKWDSETMGYLRNVLGFDGVVVTDWWALRATQTDPVPDLEGNMLSEQSFEWLYNRAIELGTDVFGAGSMTHGYDHETVLTRVGGNWPDVIIHGIETGEINMDALHESSARILRFKFRKGLFENPYRVVEEALATVASAEYQAEQWPLDTNEALRAARRPDEVELQERLQAESAVLVKNDGAVLPIAQGAKVYIDASNASTLDHYKEYIAKYGEVVEDIEDADVVVGYYSSINDAAMMTIDDAQYYGKPVILTMTSKVTEWQLVNADAVLYIPYSQQPDHGSGEAGFIYGTEPWVYAKLLFGVVEPSGIIQKEQARDSYEDALQWRDLAGDQGASNYVRLIVQGFMEDDPMHAAPSNLGDPLISYPFSMRYGQVGEFKYSCMILPQSVSQTTSVDSRGRTSVTTVTTNKAFAGETFDVYCLLRNVGADDITTVQVLANGNVVAEKIYTVCGGSWRVVEIPLTLAAGSYTIEIGGMTQDLIVEFNK